MNQLQPYLDELSSELSIFTNHFRDLKYVETSLNEWNRSFGSMTLALKAIGDTYYKNVEKEPVVEKKLSSDIEISSNQANTNNREPNNTVLQKRKSIAPKTAEKSAKKKKTSENKVDDAWTTLYKANFKDLPKKYQSKGEHLKRLEVVWRIVHHKTLHENGAVLSDVVKVCGCSVLQANEYLAALIKIKVIQRHKAKQALVYQSVGNK